MESIRDKVLDYLKKNPTGATPTEIGLALGKDYNQASSAVTAPLKKLIDLNLVKKMKIDKKLKYYLV